MRAVPAAFDVMIEFEAKLMALVPPFAIGSVPVTFVVRSMEPASIAFVIAEAPMVRAPLDSDRSEPRRLLKDEPLIIKFVVEAVRKEE